jgi:O-antigen/teichoic acid export membrane protein
VAELTVAAGTEEPTSSVFRGAVALMVSTVASSALGMIFWLVGARLVEPHHLGQAAAGASAVTLLGGLAQLSLSSVFVRFLPLAGRGVGAFMRRAYAASASVAVILAVGFSLAGLARDFLPAGPVALLVFCLAVVCSAYTALQDGALTAFGRTTWVPAANVGVAVSKVVLLPVLVGAGLSGAALYAWAGPVIVVPLVMATTIFAFLMPAHRRRAGDRGTLPQRGELTGFMVAENISGVLGALIFFSPPVLVTLVAGPEQNAYFYVPWLIGSASAALCWNITMSFVVAAATDPAGMRAHLGHAVRLLLLVTVGGALVLVSLGTVLLGFLGGDYARHAIAPLRLIALALPFAMISDLFAMRALMEKRAWQISLVRLATTVLFLGGAVLALHRYGIAGAAGSYLVTEIVVGSVLAPFAVRGLRRLVRSAPGRAPARARGVASVPRLGPGYDVSSVQVVYVPLELVDWDRLGRAETFVLPRVSGPVPPGSHPTIPMVRLPRDDETPLIARPEPDLGR